MENKGERIALDTQAYMPFHVGAFLHYSLRRVAPSASLSFAVLTGWGACIGRVSALRTMRSVLAALLRRFDLRFAPGFDVGAWERETSTLVARELWVVLHERKV
jgi:cytochrome P450